MFCINLFKECSFLSLWGVLHAVVFNTVLFFALLAHIRAMITDPGVVPIDKTLSVFRFFSPISFKSIYWNFWKFLKNVRWNFNLFCWIIFSFLEKNDSKKTGNFIHINIILRIYRTINNQEKFCRRSISSGDDWDSDQETIFMKNTLKYVVMFFFFCSTSCLHYQCPLI